jgi:segregation and condensation protein A
MIDYIQRRLLLEERPVRLKRLLQNLHTRNALVSTFLALLEMVRLQAILLRQDQVFTDIIIKKSPQFDTIMAEQRAARDDWK